MAAQEITKSQKVTVFILVAVIVVLLAVALVYVYRQLTSFDQVATPKTTSATKKTAITQKKPVVTSKSASASDDEQRYKGWQTYSNHTWAISVRYPATWTKTETSGNLHVTFLGPAATPGGAILNECMFSVFVEDISALMKLQSYVDNARNKPMGTRPASDEILTSIDGNDAIEAEDTYVDAGLPYKKRQVWTIKNKRAYTFTYAASINYSSTDYYIMHITDAELIQNSITIP